MGKERIGRTLHALNTTIHRFVEIYSHKRENDLLTGANTWVILFIAEQKDTPVYLRDIERHFGVTRSTASKVVDLLVRKGFVQRHVGKTDSRLRRLTLTKQSEDLLETICADHEMLEQILVKGFTAKEIAALLSYLDGMQENIEAAERERQKALKEETV